MRTKAKCIRFTVVPFTLLMTVSLARGQTPRDPLIRDYGEFSGVVGGSALLGDGAVPDGMWGVKIGGTSQGRFGVEGSLEQSLRESRFRIVVGDFVLQFPQQNRKRPIPFFHVGAGAVLCPGYTTGIWSFGGGVKQYINERVGIRFGIQDRMPFRSLAYHRLDFYGGVSFRF